MSTTAVATEPAPIHSGHSHPAFAVGVGLLAAGMLLTASVLLLREDPTAGRIVGAIAMGLVGVAIVPFQFFDARHRRFELTDRSLVFRHGLLNRVEIEVPYTSIRAVSLRQGLVQRLFRCGDVQVSTEASIPNTGMLVSAADAGTIVLRSIARAREVSLVLRNLMHGT